MVRHVSSRMSRRRPDVGRARRSGAALFWKGLEPLRNRIRGRRIFFTGGTGLEVPLARFLADAGAVVLEVGTPRLEKRFLAAELAALGEDVDVVESPEWRGPLGGGEDSPPAGGGGGPGGFVPPPGRG